MISSQRLEQLFAMEKSFAGIDSLEAVVASERIKELREETNLLLKKKAFLREERRTIRYLAEKTNDMKTALGIIRRPDWCPFDSSYSKVCSQRLKLNVGGMVFEIPKVTLERDKGSILYELSDDSVNSSYQKDDDGFYYFERDWWIFRYIVSFIRDGVLPNDKSLLLKLYKEALFWKLKELTHAIQYQKLKLNNTNSNDSQSNSSSNEVKKWWQEIPNWIQAVKVQQQETQQTKEEIAISQSDWWTDRSYKGKTFLPLSTNPEQITTVPGSKDELLLPRIQYEVPDSFITKNQLENKW